MKPLEMLVLHFSEDSKHSISYLHPQFQKPKLSWIVSFVSCFIATPYQSCQYGQTEGKQFG